MANPREVATAEELTRLLKESGILGPAELCRAEKIAAETTHHLTLARRLMAQRLITRWQAGQLLVGWTKLRLGKYVLQSQIGRNEHGRVFRAAHAQLQREVAIKTLSRRFTSHPEIVDQFLADAREVAALDHRNIVHIFDVDSGDDQYYMVMEYVHGSDVRRRVEDTGPLAIGVAANYLVQAATGLAYAHQHNVIHRDLQPANLLVDDKGVVKIVGWGIGRLSGLRLRLDVHAEDPHGVSDSAYLAPEQSGIHDLSDARSDLYALGCTAYFMLTGQTPVPADVPAAVPAAVPGATPTDIAELRSDIPPGLAAVIRRMMARDPESRYATADEVARDVQPWVGAEPAAAAPGVTELADAAGDESFDWTPTLHAPARAAKPTASDDSAKTPVRGGARHLSKRALYLAGALLLLIVLGAAGTLAYWWSRSDRTPSPQGPSRQRSAPETQPRLRKRDHQAAAGAWSKTPRPASGVGTDAADPASAAAPSAPAAAGTSPQTPAPPDASMTPPTDAPTPAAPDPAAAQPPPSPEGGDAAPKPSAATPPPSEPEPPPESQPPPANAAPPATDPLANPWNNWPTAVDLPPTVREADAPAIDVPVDFATLAAPLPAPLAVALLGGATAGLRGTAFQLVPSTGADPPHWQISAAGDSATDAAPRVVASLRLQDNRLRFQWDVHASEVEGVAHLGNCVLRLTSGTHTHNLRLRQPQHTDPLRIDLKKQSTTMRVKVLAPPDPRQVRLQVTSVSEPWPRSVTINPPTPIAVNEGKLQISLGPDPETQVLLLELTPELKTVFQVECGAFFRVKPDAEPVLLVLKRVLATERAVALNQERANEQAIALRNLVINTAPTDPALGPRQEQSKKADADLAEGTKMTQAMAALAEIRSAVAAGAAIEFRVFFLADDCEVDLLRSGPGTHDEAGTTTTN